MPAEHVSQRGGATAAIWGGSNFGLPWMACVHNGATGLQMTANQGNPSSWRLLLLALTVCRIACSS